MAIEFEIDGAGFNVTATEWSTLAESDRVEQEIRSRLEDLAAADSPSFRAAYWEILTGKNGNHAIVDIVSTIWQEAGGDDEQDEPAFANLVDVKAIGPLPDWAA